MTVSEPAARSSWRRKLSYRRSAVRQQNPDDRVSWLAPVLGLAVLVLVAGGALWATLDWLDRVAAMKVAPNAALGGKDYVVAKLDAVKIALSIIAGGGALFALYLAVRRQMTAERDLRARLDAQTHTEDDARARRVTELYTKAADQLGSDKAPVRLAGLYALERLAQDNPNQRQTAVNVLCAYLRMPYTLPGDPPADDADEQTRTRHDTSLQEREVRFTAQHILIDHLNPGPGPDPVAETFWPDIDLNLTGATLIDLNLAGCRIGVGGFTRAKFVGDAGFDTAEFTMFARFDGAEFFRNASFENAEFGRDASFSGAQVAGTASFTRAKIVGNALLGDAEFGGDASFYEAEFGRDASFLGTKVAGTASFGGAKVAGIASFICAEFAGNAWFDDAEFGEGASFEGAKFTGHAEFTRAKFVGDAEFRNARFERGVPIEVARFVPDTEMASTVDGDTAVDDLDASA